MKKIIAPFLCMIALILCSCATIRCTIYCENPEVSLVVNETNLGSGLIHYQAPNGTEYITIHVMKDGIEIYSRQYYVKDYHNNELIEITIPEEYRYSDTHKFHD